MTWGKARLVSVALAALGLGAVVSAQQQQQQQKDQQQLGGDQSRQSASQGQAGRGQPADRQIEQLLTKVAEDPETAADKLFLLTAVLNNQAQIQLAQEVMQKSQNDQVKKLAQRMVQELSTEDRQLRQVAQSLGLQIPEGLARADALEIEIIAALPADQLDQSYVASVQADGASDASTYQSQAQIARNAKVREIAQEQARSQQARSQQANQTSQAIGMRGVGGAQPASGNLRGNSDGNR